MAVTQNEASRVADRLRHIADHLDLIGQVDLPADPSTGDRSLTVARTLEVCLLAILQNPGIANSSVRNAKPCVILKRIRVDAMMTILSFLDTKSLVKFAMTCWAMHRVIVKADYIWKCLAEINFPMWCFTIRDTPKNALADQTSIWRKLYLERIYADHPWKTKKTPDVMVKRFQRGIHALYFDRDTLLLGSGQYNEVLSFDLKTGRLHSGANGPGMFGHSQAVTALRPLKQNPELLMTSSLDTSLRLFNRTSMHLLKAYLGHTDKIWCVDVHENRVFSGSSDKTVRIWDLDSTESVCEPLRSHRTSISAIKVMTNLSAPLLLTGSAGNTIRVWDLANGEPRCIEKLRGHTKGVFSLQATPNVLMSGSLDNVIKVWDPRQNWRLVYDLRQKDARGQDLVAYTEDTDTNIGVIAFQCDDTKVVSGGPDKMLRVWDLRTRSIVNEFGGHDHWITTLQFDENKIVTGSRDKTVRFWDISGKLLQELHPSFHDPDDNPQLPPALGPPAVAPPI